MHEAADSPMQAYIIVSKASPYAFLARRSCPGEREAMANGEQLMALSCAGKKASWRLDLMEVCRMVKLIAMPMLPPSTRVRPKSPCLTAIHVDELVETAVKLRARK